MAILEILVTCRCGKESRASIPTNTDDGALRCTACGGHLLRFRLLKGYVYILSNPRKPGLFKVGCTTREVEDRVEELNSATGVPTPFTVEAYFASSAPDEHEREAHSRLKAKRVKAREFFEAGLAEILEAVRAVVGTDPVFLRDTSMGLPPRQLRALGGTRWSCGLCKHEWTVGVDCALDCCPLCGGKTLVCLRGARR